MPTYYARKSGNVNATDVWATTPSGTAAAQTFASGDVLVANSFTITVNVDTNLGSTGEVRNDTTGGATNGGSFSLSNNVVLTANVFAGSASCVTTAGTVSATVTGNVTGATSNFVHGISHASSGTLTVTGSITSGSGVGANGINTGVGSTLTLTGSMTGGSTSGGNGPAAVVVNGNATITGNATAGSIGNAFGVQNAGAGSVTVTGTMTGGTNSTAAGAQNNASGSLTIVGTCTGGTAGPGAVNASTGTLAVTRAKGGAAATAAVGVAVTGTGAVSVDEIEYGDLGASPTSGPIRLTDKTSNVAVMYRFGTTKKNLVDANASGLMPAASNVRSGTVYNGGNSTGTCAVPAASSVASGVAVDNTTGTAVLTSAAVQTACDAALAAFSSGRLGNVATVASVGQQLANALTPS